VAACAARSRTRCAPGAPAASPTAAQSSAPAGPDQPAQHRLGDQGVDVHQVRVAADPAGGHRHLHPVSRGPPGDAHGERPRGHVDRERALEGAQHPRQGGQLAAGRRAVPGEAAAGGETAVRMTARDAARPPGEEDGAGEGGIPARPRAGLHRQRERGSAGDERSRGDVVHDDDRGQLPRGRQAAAREPRPDRPEPGRAAEARTSASVGRRARGALMWHLAADSPPASPRTLRFSAGSAVGETAQVRRLSAYRH
jgi:hypothetical protein